MHTKAQGTIEYLVIVGVVVVLSLVVVSLVVGNVDSTKSTSSTTSTIFSSIGSGGISVTDAISDYDGTGIINLSNYSGEARSLTKIITDEGENEYNDKLIGDDGIDISGLCNCEEGMKNKTCNFKFYFKETLEPINLQVTIKCEDDFEPKEPPTLPTDCFNPNKNPIPICSLTDLNQIRTNLSGNYILMKNIDATETSTWNSGLGWEPIGKSQTPFKGILNGDNHIILNIYSYGSSDEVGLFGVTFPPAIIQNLKLVDVNIGGATYVGGLIGSQYGIIPPAWDTPESTLVHNVRVTGFVRGGSSVGGLIGSASGKITNSYSDVNIIGAQWVGGLVGAFLSPGEIEKSVAKGNILSRYNPNKAGGLVGSSSGKITDSYSSGTIYKYRAGGLIGWLYGGDTFNSYSTTKILYDYSSNGGLISIGSSGYTSQGGETQNSYWDINVSNYEISYAGTGKTTLEMKQQSTFEDWNFDTVWSINPNKNEGYPYLQWED